MTLLRNFDAGNKYCEFYSKIEQDGSPNLKIKGWYKLINGIFYALLVKDSSLFFCYNDNEVLITDNYFVILRTNASNVSKEFILMNGDEEVVNFIYTVPDSDLTSSPFEYIDEEDFMWGDFVAQIINNPERKQGFVINLQ